MVKLYSVIILVLIGITAYSQGIRLKDADPFSRNEKDNLYGLSNETGYIFNTSKDKTIQILGKNYYDTPSLIKKDDHIYVAVTLKDKIRIPTQNKKYAKLKAELRNKRGDNIPYMLKTFTVEPDSGKLLETSEN